MHSRDIRGVRTLTSDLQRWIYLGEMLILGIIERLKSDEEKDEEEEEEEETATPQLTQLQEFEFDKDVIFVSVELQSEEKIEMAKHYLLPHSFYNYDTKPPALVSNCR